MQLEMLPSKPEVRKNKDLEVCESQVESEAEADLVRDDNPLEAQENSMAKKIDTIEEFESQNIEETSAEKSLSAANSRSRAAAEEENEKEEVKPKKALWWGSLSKAANSAKKSDTPRTDNCEPKSEVEPKKDLYWDKLAKNQQKNHEEEGASK